MMSSAVLEELEVACGQNVDHIFEKRFSGDFRLGLKVLGNISQVKYSGGCIFLFVPSSFIYAFSGSALGQHSAFKAPTPTWPKD